MINLHTRTTLALTMLIIVAALAAYSWYLDPEDGWRYLIAMSVLPVGWLMHTAISAWGQRGEKSEADQSDLIQTRKIILGSMILAGMIISVSLVATVLEDMRFISDAAKERAFHVALGLVVLLTGNAMPKNAAHAREKDNGNYSRSLSVTRFGGWAFVVAGFAYSVLWLFAPEAIAEPLSIGFVAVALCLTLVRALWAFLT